MFAWDGVHLRFTHTKTRRKFANLKHEPRVAISIADPDDGYRFLEVRGVVKEIVDDSGNAAFYRSLQCRYGFTSSNTDLLVRVVVVVRPTSFVGIRGGRVVASGTHAGRPG